VGRGALRGGENERHEHDANDHVAPFIAAKLSSATFSGQYVASAGNVPR
jgi:hypothetical protein